MTKKQLKKIQSINFQTDLKGLIKDKKVFSFAPILLQKFDKLYFSFRTTKLQL